MADDAGRARSRSGGTTLRGRGRGLPTRGGNGDLRVTAQITLPERLGDDARQAIETYAAATANHDPRVELWGRNHIAHARSRA